MSKTEICNFAMSHLGIGTDIADVDTESSNEARACRRFYKICLDKILRDYEWPFATEIVSPSLEAEEPNDEWCYAFRYPSDCIKIRKIQSGIRNDSRQSKVSYRVSQDDDGKLIWTDVEEPKIEYTKLVEDTDDYPPDFKMALSYLLAHYVAPRLTGGDPFDLQRKLIQLYSLELSGARKNSRDEEQRDEEVYSEFERGRV